ncbi:alpha-ketoglutarate-dependent dioxygenase AlkB [Nannocystis pusilla]|uniref:Alpha-ketoglutarate-dependent dioxygenase AlkB n=1 Tax=Nannocystis pusilla TaxID=889268 RepID=A0ABS7TXK8_9BACT|nr:alpha-ketoglutarate-dependent dioxygenase AlkB [Nannocystis pusilla]MBZ5712988.1 alpha-ketoglutarate-dependent dioxygenase AlkB [Nannocystis pusilla]
MARPRIPEARIVDTRQVLIVLAPRGDERPVDGFAGAVVTEPSAGLPDLAGKAVYLCGDVSKAAALDLSAASRILVIREGSHGDAAGDLAPWPVVSLGRVPIHVHGLGVYYRCYFDPEVDYVARIRGEHVFQSLTESTKPATAHRTGLYLTPVRKERDALHFRLLRCSTNLSGPTDNFRSTDRHIVDALNQEAALVFSGAAPLNHVLAQIYHNTPADLEKKQAKARISSHADKTKDMPDHGVMAFCTFYEHLDRLGPMAGDPFDRGHRGISGLTRLRFRLKEVEAAERGTSPDQFTITLYPNSVFFMPLSTNRRYTHEIVPSELDAARLPTRLGYVVRCSKTEAVHEDGRTFLLRDGARVELEAPTPEGMTELRRLYAEENKTSAHIDYGDGFRFSMNAGDYRAPNYEASDLFRTYTISTEVDLFAELSASARLEELGKGRRGAVLVVTESSRGVPIVRTTTAYTLPAQCFRPIHAALARQVCACASLAIPFNNALLEVYSRAYATMGAHSDQTLDLDDAGEIALFSCYEHREAGPSRRLMVESKEPGGPSFVIPLLHGRVVVFSADTNRRFRHRIVLDPAAGAPDNTWLGVTFRTSKTWVHVRDGQPRLADGTPLTLADDEERREFLRLRRLENQEIEFIYPRVTCTLSPSDLWPPETATTPGARAARGLS